MHCHILCPFSRDHNRRHIDGTPALGTGLDYVELVDWRGRMVQQGKR